jgi:hypothetical protein
MRAEVRSEVMLFMHTTCLDVYHIQLFAGPYDRLVDLFCPGHRVWQPRFLLVGRADDADG